MTDTYVSICKSLRNLPYILDLVGVLVEFITKALHRSGKMLERRRVSLGILGAKIQDVV